MEIMYFYYLYCGSAYEPIVLDTVQTENKMTVPPDPKIAYGWLHSVLVPLFTPMALGFCPQAAASCPDTAQKVKACMEAGGSFLK